MAADVTNAAAGESPAGTRGRLVHSAWARSLLTFLVVFGPGLIVMEADNDAGAVSTYTQAGQPCAFWIAAIAAGGGTILSSAFRWRK
jgi:hypothetical protein